MRIIFFLLLLISTNIYADDVTVIVEAIMELRPKAVWNLKGDKYEGLVWLDQSQTKPTKDEVNLKIEERKAKPKRPSVWEQLKALFEGGTAQEDMKELIRQSR